MDWEQHFRSMRPRPRVEFGADEFGAMARGAQVPGQAAGVVTIPPGRYWLDVFGANISRFHDWAKSKPQVKIVLAQENTDQNPAHLFVIFEVPTTANDFNVNGVWWQPTVFGFPTIADATVQSSEDTVQRPKVTEGIDGLLQSLGLESGTTPPPPGQGWWPPSTATMLKIGLVGAAVVAVATLPSVLLKRVL